MCDDKTERENREYLKQRNVSRRTFNVIGAAAGMSMLLPQAANAKDIVKSQVNIQTPDGAADCFFVHPVQGSHAGVIIWPDLYGLRPVFEMMGARLAESGYAVLVANPYYRHAAAPVIAEDLASQDDSAGEKLITYARALTAETTASDAGAFVEFLDQQAAVDSHRKMGTTGYCMGGAMTIQTAAALPDRIGAGGSFHGGGLVTNEPDSPHLLVPATKASYLYAIAENDDQRHPESKEVLRKAYDEAGLSAEIEVYGDSMHGWCVPTSSIYNEAQAERAWSRLLVLFEKSLA